MDAVHNNIRFYIISPIVSSEFYVAASFILYSFTENRVE